jgi:hypothetical protein
MISACWEDWRMSLMKVLSATLMALLLVLNSSCWVEDKRLEVSLMLSILFLLLEV